MADSTAGETRKIILRSSDGEVFEVDEAAALMCQTIKYMIEDGCADSAIPLPNVTGKIMAKVVEYCKRHADAPKEKDEELKTFDAEFVDVEKDVLFELMLASNYLNITGLLDLTCQAAADMIKSKTPEQVRTLFNIKNDFTEEEEEEVRRENSWAFE